MQTRAVSSHRKIDGQNSVFERGEYMTVEPVTEDRTLGSVTSFRQQNAQLQFENCDGRNKKCAARNSRGPRGDIGVGLACFGLAKFRNYVGIENEHQDRSAARNNPPERGASNSTSAAPGAASNSIMLAPGASASRRYSSILNRTCAGRPRSVMNTGPSFAAFFALPASWLNSRLDRVVMGTSRSRTMKL